MSGYCFSIVLVILSTLQLNTIVRASKDTVSYYPYDNACTRITPAATADEVAGLYRIYYTSLMIPPCSIYSIFKYEDYYLKRFHDVDANDESNMAHFISNENPAKPGQMQDYPSYYYPILEDSFKLQPEVVSVIVALHRDIGHGMIECPAKNGSEVSNVFVFGILKSDGQPKEKMIDIKEQVMKLGNFTELLDERQCWN
ncbi:hypothetical protein CHUAL_000175 [Chamberlinius hualienensis]